MRVGVLSKSDVRGGGASAVAGMLVASLKKKGISADHINLESDQFHPFGGAKSLIEDFKKYEARRGLRDYYSVEKLSPFIRRLHQKYDVLHLHDMSTVLSHTAIGWLSTKLPTVFTLHDCSAFTAGCLYPGKCEKFLTNCGKCPQLGNWPLDSRIDNTRKLHSSRRQLDQSKVMFTAPSNWMIGEYNRAGWNRKKIQLIKNGIDKSNFKPRDKEALRCKYGLSDHKGIFLFYGAGWIHDDRKGPREVASLARSVKSLNPKIVMMGRWSNEAAKIFRGLNISHFGFVKSEIMRSELMGLSDYCLMFSKEENAPLTVLEALASGVRILGYKTGGVPEIVTNSDAGALVDVGASYELARYLVSGNQTPDYTFSRLSELVDNIDDIAQDYFDLYGNVIAEFGR